MNDNHALVVLPGAAYGRVPDHELCRWLSAGAISLVNPETEMLDTVLTTIGETRPASGLAALRFWGQTGDRSARWIAAADPVHLEARLRDLRVHPLPHDQYSAQELRGLFDTLQAELGTGEEISFAKVGKFGYLQCDEPLATAPVSASIASNHAPDRFAPAGAGAGRFHRLLGEIQMLLHAHDVNTERGRVGKQEMNSLWIWGGGIAPESEDRVLPPLYCNDPLFNGYWASRNCAARDWQGLDECVADSPLGFIAVTPAISDDRTGDVLLGYLQDLQRHLRDGNLRRLTLLCRDGLTIRLNRFDRFRFWRKVSPLLQEMSHE